MTVFLINPVSLMRTMTMALDLALDGVSLHQRRTAIICCHLAQSLDLRLQDEQALLSAALMHDIGAASNTDERQRLADPVLTVDMGRDIYLHAENGYNLLKNSDPFEGIAEAIRHHHDQWSGGNP
jgi:putative nucleotidyltransferase with HDIG domain